LEALGNLVAIAMERARAVEQLGQTEATREGERLRTALLDAVTHELRTTLTSIKASVTGLLSNAALSPAQRHELLTIINEESDRLNRLVGEAAEMSRLHAGDVELRLAPHPIEEVIRNARDQCKSALGGWRSLGSTGFEFRLRTSGWPTLPVVGEGSGAFVFWFAVFRYGGCRTLSLGSCDSRFYGYSRLTY
ncbi:MAG: sensor histidine kinase, partial [Candidatus Acidiferrales bacterium]